MFRFSTLVVWCWLCVSVIHNECWRVEALKIAFVGDTGIEDEESNGYGDKTMAMIDAEGVDLVVDVGDFEYWGRCTESYTVTDTFTVTSTTGQTVTVLTNEQLHRFQWKYRDFRSSAGWEIGLEGAVGVVAGVTRSWPGDPPNLGRLVISDDAWEGISDNLQVTSGERECYGEPWDGPTEWDNFLRRHKFAFLGVSGNTEITEAPDYGSPEIWASHQRYLYQLYQERIVKPGKGVCHGYINQTDPGTEEEYGERFSCFYGPNEDHHFILLGWDEGSTEHWNDVATEARRMSVEFIEREFSTPRSQRARWRYCIHHMTSAKLSSAGKDREHMELSGITDACRRHGALIFSGHHHIYSRTKLLNSVGGPLGDEEVTAVNSSVLYDGINSHYNSFDNSTTITEGVTMSVTVGMGGYDGACNGLYWNASWMELCVASPTEHRGAVIAEFNDDTPWMGTFRYMSSVADGSIVDEFKLTSKLPGWNAFIPSAPDEGDETETGENDDETEADPPPPPASPNEILSPNTTTASASSASPQLLPQLFFHHHDHLSTGSIVMIAGLVTTTSFLF